MDPSVVDHARDGESRHDEIIIILAVGCLIGTVVVALRSYTRLAIIHTFGLDDALIIVAHVLAIGAGVCIGFEAKFGLGQHTWVQPPENFIPYMKSFYSSIVLYNVAFCIVKLSILLQYRRVFAVDFVRYLTTGGVTIIAAWTITLSFLLPLVCFPVAAFWDSTVEGRCLNSLAIWYTMAAVNLVTDIFLFCLPLPVIKSLKLPRRQKYILYIIFSLGFFTCIISVIRLRTLSVAATTKDPNWDNTDAAIWSFVELMVGILATCLPTLRPLLVILMPRVFGGTSRNTGSRPSAAYLHASNSKGIKSLSSNRRATHRLNSKDISLLKDAGLDLKTIDLPIQGTMCYPGSVNRGRPDQHKDPLRSHPETFGIVTSTMVTQEVASDDDVSTPGSDTKPGVNSRCFA